MSVTILTKDVGEVERLFLDEIFDIKDYYEVKA